MPLDGFFNGQCGICRSDKKLMIDKRNYEKNKYIQDEQLINPFVIDSKYQFCF